MKLSFFGATRQVTGSMYLLELEEDFRILIDCGTNMDQKNERVKSEYGLFPFDPTLVNLVVLTHAHIDHSGQIPNLYKNGYEGQVLCTSPSLALTEILLYDSASLNQKKLNTIEKSKKRSNKRKHEDSEALYLSRQVKEAIENFVPIEFSRRFKIKPGAWVTFIPAGHLLGAAHVLFEIEQNGELRKIGFSGDIGRKNYPLLVDPSQFPEVDYLICESTYGNRFHDEQGDPLDVLEEIVRESCIDKPGRMIVPAFSVGRTQAFLYTLNKLFAEKGLKRIKVFTDSPLAKESTHIYEKYTYLLNNEAKEFKEENDELFDFENLIYVKSDKDSKEISNHLESCIIISSSGMIQGGRVEQHVANNIENPYATILFIGYATEGTIGHRLKTKDLTKLIIQGASREVKAQIKSTDVFSGHGDLKDLLNFVGMQNQGKLKKIFLVHGELDSMLNFKAALENKNFNQVEIPLINQTFEL